MPDPNSLNNGMPPVDANGNFLNPEAFQGMMNGQGMMDGMGAMNGQNFMADPSMAGFVPMGNEQLMMPLMPANGHHPPQAQHEVSAGK